MLYPDAQPQDKSSGSGTSAKPKPKPIPALPAVIYTSFGIQEAEKLRERIKKAEEYRERVQEAARNSGKPKQNQKSQKTDSSRQTTQPKTPSYDPLSSIQAPQSKATPATARKETSDIGKDEDEASVQAAPPDIADMQGNPIDPSDMEFYGAAYSNPVLNEAQTAIQHEGIPPAFQGDSDSYLRLFGEWGIDEDNDAEARFHLNHWTQRLLERNSGNPLNTAREEALDEFGAADAAESFNSYKELVEDTFDVRFIHTGKADEWNLINVITAHVGLEQTARALGARVRDMSGLTVDDAAAFRLVFGKITLNRSTGTGTGGAVAQVGGRTITIFRKQDNTRNYNLLSNLLLHELGHIFNAAAGQGDKRGQGSINTTDGHPGSRVGMGAPDPSILLGDLYIPRQAGQRLLYEDLAVSSDHGSFTEADLDAFQIQSLQQSMDQGRNEVTADAFLNWVAHQTSGGVYGFTNAPEGLNWQEFMDANMDKWIRNAIVHNAPGNENALAFFAEHGMLPQAVGSGTIPPGRGSKVRDTPSKDGDIVATLKAGETLPVFGRIEADDSRNWIAVMVQGDMHWVRVDVINLPEGVNLNDLPLVKKDAGFEFDPNSSFEETPWFSQFVQHLMQEDVNA